MTFQESRNEFWMKRLSLLIGLLLLAMLSFTGLAAAQSQEFPTYYPGQNQNGTVGPNYPSTLPDPWVGFRG